MGHLRQVVLLVMLFAACLFLRIPDFMDPAQLACEDHILFIGNSFTHGHSMPDLLSEIAREAEPRLCSEMSAPGGVTLEWHYTNKGTMDKLSQRRWSAVVLQDCSRCPLDSPDFFEEDVSRMVAEARARKIRPLLFMTWADAGQFKDQEVISDAYSRLARRLNVELVPVGTAWQLASAKGVRLYEADNHHASFEGALLTAYTFLRFLRPSSPEPAARSFAAPPETFIQLLLRGRVERIDDHVAEILWHTAGAASNSP